MRSVAERVGMAVVASGAALILISLSGAATAQNEPPPPALVLEELVDGEVRCISTGPECTDVNLYGQDARPDMPPIVPGEVRTTIVQLRNAGDIAASSLDLTPGTCRNEPLDGRPLLTDLCATVTVAIACSMDGTTFSFGPQTLAAFGEGGSRQVIPGLAAGSSATCEFTVTYPPGAPVIQAIRAVQPITKTLTAPEPRPEPPAPPGPPAPPAPTPVPPPGVLPVTGSNSLLPALAGLALVLAGGVVHRLSRRDDTGTPG
jgi:LPXTG-motif cell wall-anchored protein